MNNDIIKTAVIRQELLELTGDYKKAIILNQFIYWHSRVRDYDKFLQEEKERGDGKEIDFRNGWIYKKADELSAETMLGLSPSNMRKHIKSLVDNGWIQERSNPKHKWDKTIQYRVDVTKIQNDLIEIGYSADIGRKYAVSKTKTRGHEIENQDAQNETSLITESKVEITTGITLLQPQELAADDGSEKFIDSLSRYTKRRFGKPLRRVNDEACIEFEVYKDMDEYELIDMLDRNITNYNQCNLNYLSSISERIRCTG